MILIHKKESILFNYQWLTVEPHTPICEDSFNEYWASVPYKRKQTMHHARGSKIGGHKLEWKRGKQQRT